MAVSADGDSWFVLNASPDLRQQIEAHRQLWPRSGTRDSPIAGVVLTNGDVDAIAGLLTLRERHPFRIWATARVLGILSANSLFDVLTPELVSRQVLAPDTPFDLTLPDGRPSGLRATGFFVPGKIPLYEEAGAAPSITESDATIGIAVANATSRVVFAPSCAAVTPTVADHVRGADVLLFDGTLWRDDEMIRAGLGGKTGLRMGHISMSGPEGAIARLAGLDIGRRVFLHINNSNPVLLDDSREFAEARAHGWEIAHDGMEIRV